MLLPARALAEIRDHAKGHEKLRPPLEGCKSEITNLGTDRLENWYDDTAGASSLPLADFLHQRGILDERTVELLKKAPIGLASRALLALGPSEPDPSAFIKDELMNSRAGGVKDSAKYFNIEEEQMHTPPSNPRWHSSDVQPMNSRAGGVKDSAKYFSVEEEQTRTPPPNPRWHPSLIRPGTDGDGTYNSRSYYRANSDGIANREEDGVNGNSVSGARATGAGAEPLAELASSPVRTVYLSQQPRRRDCENWTWTPNKTLNTRSRHDGADSGWQQWPTKTS